MRALSQKSPLFHVLFMPFRRKVSKTVKKIASLKIVVLKVVLKLFPKRPITKQDKNMIFHQVPSRPLDRHPTRGTQIVGREPKICPAGVILWPKVFTMYNPPPSYSLRRYIRRHFRITSVALQAHPLFPAVFDQ